MEIRLQKDRLYGRSAEMKFQHIFSEGRGHCQKFVSALPAIRFVPKFHFGTPGGSLPVVNTSLCGIFFSGNHLMFGILYPRRTGLQSRPQCFRLTGLDGIAMPSGSAGYSFLEIALCWHFIFFDRHCSQIKTLVS